MHGAREDVEWIQRDFGLYIVNLFDTCEAAKSLGYANNSLVFLLNQFVNISVDKTLRLSDWRLR
jgi:exosome complex exonuclease RRP6